MAWKRESESIKAIETEEFKVYLHVQFAQQFLIFDALKIVSERREIGRGKL